MRYLVVCILAACAGANLEAQYANDLEDCLHMSNTCQEYVACRKAVAEKYHREFSGRCE